MEKYGLLFDYEYCTGCGSCLVSCQEEHDYQDGKTGIKILTDGPWKIDDEFWNFNHWPVVTDMCDLCEERVGKGKEPICVHHCLANIITYGTIEDLSKKLAEKPKQFLVIPQFNPNAARGAFVSQKTGTHKAAHIEVEGTGTAAFAVHRHDTKVGDVEDFAKE